MADSRCNMLEGLTRSKPSKWRETTRAEHDCWSGSQRPKVCLHTGSRRERFCAAKGRYPIESHERQERRAACRESIPRNTVYFEVETKVRVSPQRLSQIAPGSGRPRRPGRRRLRSRWEQRTPKQLLQSLVVSSGPSLATSSTTVTPRVRSTSRECAAFG